MDVWGTDRPFKTQNIIDHSITLKANGNIWINRAGLIGMQHEDKNPYNLKNPQYKFSITKDNCKPDTTLVKVEEESKIIIGDYTNGHTAKLHIWDSARLKIYEKGEVLIDAYSEMIVQKDAVVTIEDKGKLIGNPDSKIVIKKGGLLVVEFGGVLELLGNAELIVEEGGTIMTQNGAIFRFQDGDLSTNGRCHVVIKPKGIFLYNGKWIHDGNGYVQFDVMHVFDQRVPALMTGYDQSIRFIRLNMSAELIIKKFPISIANGKIEYEPNSSIYIEEQTLDATKVNFIGTNKMVPSFAMASKAINAYRPYDINIQKCNFNDLAYGINMDNFFKIIGASIYVRTTGFNYTEYPFYVKNAKSCIMDSVMIFEGRLSNFYNCNELRFNNGAVNSTAGGLTLSEGDIIVNNSRFNNNGQGINLSFNANAFVYRSSFTNNFQGINSNGDENYGLVELGCNFFEHNVSSIVGRDVLLNISPLNANGNSKGPVGNNQFLIGNGQFHFEIYYFARDIMEVEASYNYWGGNLPLPQEYILEKGFQSIPLLATPYHRLPTTCPLIGPNGKNAFCGNVTASGIDFNTVRNGAMDLFHNGDKDGTIRLMNQISDSQDRNYYSSDPACRFNYDYARIFTHKDLNTGTLPIYVGVDDKGEKNLVECFPNPFQNEIKVHFNEKGNYSLELINSLGVIISSGVHSSDFVLSTEELVKGNYFLKILNNETGKTQIQKLFKQ
ncbi:MAG TPA: T9SS type A sorting domain-containing protein [Saprospiraceae bacterium]|nr:T9SS type A sorting domain-containing protein [Saprospiraceae bacterium]